MTPFKTMCATAEWTQRMKRSNMPLPWPIFMRGLKRFRKVRWRFEKGLEFSDRNYWILHVLVSSMKAGCMSNFKSISWMKSYALFFQLPFDIIKPQGRRRRHRAKPCRRFKSKNMNGRLVFLRAGQLMIVSSFPFAGYDTVVGERGLKGGDDFARMPLEC